MTRKQECAACQHNVMTERVTCTHATTSFSLAYGLCYGENAADASLQHFVVRQDAIGPAGVITGVLDSATGACLRVEQTQNNVGGGGGPSSGCAAAE